MLAIDRWRNWSPSDKKFGDYAGCEPSKPPKPPFEGFEGSTSGKTQNFSGPAGSQQSTFGTFGTPTPGKTQIFSGPVDGLVDEIVAWENAVIYPWATSQCTFMDRAWGGLSSLYVSNCEWCAAHNMAPIPEMETFATILMALGFSVKDGMVYGLIFKEDLEAVHWQPEPEKIVPIRKKAGRR